AVAPGRLAGIRNADEREARTVRIREREHAFTEPLLQRLVCDALFDEAMRPIAERSRRHAERGLMRLADAPTALCGLFPRKEREDRAWLAGLVAVIKVIGAGIVEIHRPLHEAKPQRAGIEVEIAGRVSGDRGDVV